MAKAPLVPNDPYYQKLAQLLTANIDKAALFETIVNAPFHDQLRAIQLDLGIVVFLLANEKTKAIDRIALSDTFSAHGAVRMSSKPFKEIKIPIGHPTNLIAQAIATKKPHSTRDWRYLFVPALSSEEAHFNQAGAGIDCSFVYPLIGTRQGALIFSLYQPLEVIDQSHKVFFQYYSELVSSVI